ncbi:efflux transporter outer membrane subunit [Sphingomonas sp.]|uniref:efflux transporter outer membrane subunit n=1 Tax=Sphingomonas sp. TaxID=28214 RepID=UPI003B3B0E38
MRTPALLPLALTSLLLTGCTVGPNYAGPPAAAGDLSHANFVRTGNLAVAAAPGVAHWWEQLNDPLLNTLETQALAASPDLAAAEARLRQARASFRLERANQAPTASAMALYAHARLPGVDLGGGSSNSENDSASGNTTSLNLYNVGFDASWEVDLFGGQRRTVEAARAEAESAEANLADAQVSLTAEVAQAYINLRDRQRRIALNAKSVAMQEQMLALTRDRFAQGTASRLDVVRLQTQLENTRADTVPLDAEREQYLDELATLTGQALGAVDTALAQTEPVPLPPTAVAIGDPAALLRRRPDIRAAERTLAARTARIGVAEAARFPRLSLMGIIGLGGTSLSDLSDFGNVAALGAPQLSWSFLDFGRNKARVTQAEAARDEAAAQYRGTVLTALRDAEGSLSRYRNRRLVVAAQARAQLSADEAVALSLQRYRAGTTTLIDLLDTQRQQITVQQNLSLAQAGLTQDYVAIQKALGLGWS